MGPEADVSGTFDIRLRRYNSTSRRGVLRNGRSGWERDCLRRRMSDCVECTSDHESGHEQASSSRNLSRLLTKNGTHFIVLHFSVKTRHEQLMLLRPTTNSKPVRRIAPYKSKGPTCDNSLVRCLLSEQLEVKSVTGLTRHDEIHEQFAFHEANSLVV